MSTGCGLPPDHQPGSSNMTTLSNGSTPYGARSVPPDPLCALVAEALGVRPEAVSDDSSTESIEAWDSIAGMSLLVLIEETYGIAFEAGEMALLTSVSAIRRLLRDKGASV